MSRFLFQADDALLLLTGLQEHVYEAMEPDCREMCVRNCQILMRHARNMHLPVIVSEQMPELMGRTVPAINALLDDQPCIEKMSFSCWREGEVRAAIQNLNRKTVIIAGFEAHVCVMQSVMDLLCTGFHPVVARDAICSRHAAHRDAALEAIAHAGGVIYPTESIVYMLMNTATTPLIEKTMALLGWELPRASYPPRVA